MHLEIFLHDRQKNLWTFAFILGIVSPKINKNLNIGSGSLTIFICFEPSPWFRILFFTIAPLATSPNFRRGCDILIKCDAF